MTRPIRADLGLVSIRTGPAAAPAPVAPFGDGGRGSRGSGPDAHETEIGTDRSCHESVGSDGGCSPSARARILERFGRTIRAAARTMAVAYKAPTGPDMRASQASTPHAPGPGLMPDPGRPTRRPTGRPPAPPSVPPLPGSGAQAAPDPAPQDGAAADDDGDRTAPDGELTSPQNGHDDAERPRRDHDEPGHDDHGPVAAGRPAGAGKDGPAGHPIPQPSCRPSGDRHQPCRC